MEVNDAMADSDQHFQLARAILIYQQYHQEGCTHFGSDNTGPGCAATIHEVQYHGRQASLAVGVPVTTAAIEALSHSLGQSVQNSFIPDNVIGIGPAMLAWWTPACRRRIWFTVDKKENPELHKLNGRLVAHPALLFLATQNQRVELRIFALGCDRRPCEKTPVYVAPYWNIYRDGGLCQGSGAWPRQLSPSLIPKFEEAFYETAFSHSSAGRKLTRHPGAHLGLWQEMVSAKKFPHKYLQPLRRNVGAIIKGKHEND